MTDSESLSKEKNISERREDYEASELKTELKSFAVLACFEEHEERQGSSRSVLGHIEAQMLG